MLRLYSPRRAEKIIARYGEWVGFLEKRYGLPGACLRAVLYREITETDVMDLAADAAVALYWAARGLGGLLKKNDSSTGYGQIFGAVGVRAAVFGLEHGLETREELGLPPGWDPESPAALRLIWTRLRRDPAFNLRLSALNLLSCAWEITGRLDFASYSEEELQLIFTRYNADTRQITAYGRETYRLYLRYQDEAKNRAARSA